MIKFRKGTQKAPIPPITSHALKQKDVNQPIITYESWSLPQQWSSCIANRETGHELKPGQTHQCTLISIVSLIDLSGSGKYCFCEVTLVVMTLSKIETILAFLANYGIAKQTTFIQLCIEDKGRVCEIQEAKPI